jgi:lipopolysaccharide/colanic/teichoic acid biosynthesis glycosyltransferase
MIPIVPRWKRFLDVTCVVVMLPVLAPAFLLIACGIKLVSPGSVFFRQERIGFREKRFLCWKFRSMKPDADAGVHQQHLNQLIHSNVPMTKMDQRGDARLIPLGSWFRASGLDELPQLINVLRGEMSLVGPRPCTPYEYEAYAPWHKSRFNTLPGLTGLWQVSGKNHTTFKEMMDLDIFYASHKTLWMDIKILLKTFPTLAVQVKEIRHRADSSTQAALKRRAYHRANE